MSLNDIDSKTAVMAIFGSLLAYMFYGRIQDASDIQSLIQVTEQLKSEQRDLWGKYNADIDEKQKMMMDFAEYMIEQEQEKMRLERMIHDLEVGIHKDN